MLDFTKGSPWKLLTQFALPLLAGNVLMQLYIVVDTFVVGNYLGEKALAAVGASGPVVFALVSFSIGIATGCTIIISQYFGAKNFEKVKSAVDTVTVFVFIAALLILVTGLLLCEPLLRIVNTPADVMDNARVFFRLNMIGILPLFGVNVMSAILRGLGDSKNPLYYMIFSSILNVLLVLLFVPVFHWGIAGAAWATILAQTLTVASMIVWLNRKHPLVHISLRPRRFDFGIFGDSVRIGLPNGLQQALVAVGMMALLRIVNAFDSNVLAAYSIAGRIDSLASAPAAAFSITMAAFVGQNMGAFRFDRIKQGLRAALVLSTAVTAALSLVMVLFRYPIMQWFTAATAVEVIETGSRYLLIIGSFYLLFSMLFVFNGVMRGAGDTMIPMFITLLSLWLIRIPVAWALSRAIGPDGIWWSIPMGWTVGAACAWGYYRTGRWKKKGVVKPAEVLNIPIT